MQQILAQEISELGVAEVSSEALKDLLSGLYAGEMLAFVQARTICIGTVRRPWVHSLACCCKDVRAVMRDHPRPPRIHLIPCPDGEPALAVPLNDVTVVWQNGEPVTRWGVFRYKDWDFVKHNVDADEDSLVRMVLDLWDGKRCRLFMGFLQLTEFSLTEPTDTLGYVRSLDYRWSPSPVTLRDRASTMIKVTDPAAYDRHFAGIKRED